MRSAWRAARRRVLEVSWLALNYRLTTRRFGTYSLSQLGRIAYVALIVLRLGGAGLAMANVTPAASGSTPPVQVSAFFHADPAGRAPAAEADRAGLCVSLDQAGLFEADGFHLDRRWWTPLSRLSQQLVRSPGTRLTIQAAEPAADALTARRMASIRGFLVEHGVNPIRIPERPVRPSEGLTGRCPADGATRAEAVGDPGSAAADGR